MTATDYPDYLRTVNSGMRVLREGNPEAMDAFGKLHRAARAPGVLDAKVKELMALAISITVRCDGCIAYHVHDAVEAGASRDEVLETIGVAIQMGGGPSVVYGTEALTAFDQFTAARS